MDELEKLKAEVIAVTLVNQQMNALLLRFFAANEGPQFAFELLDLMDQQVSLEVRNVAMRKGIPAEVASHADNHAADMMKNLRDHLGRALDDDQT